MLGAGGHLWEHIGEAPVLLLPCQRRPAMPPRESLPPEIAARYDDELAYVDRIRGASIYPAVQNILLACRALGLGTVITTNHIRCEDEVKTVLGIPGGRRNLCPDADRLAARRVRAVDPPPARRSSSYGPLGRKLAHQQRGQECQRQQSGQTLPDPNRRPLV